MLSARGFAVWATILAAILVWPTVGVPAGAGPSAGEPAPGITAIDLDTAIDANNIGMCVSNVGMLGCHLDGPGLEYPIGSGRFCMYAAGLWIGAMVEGEVRVTLGAYIPEYKPGCIYPDGSYDQDSEPRHRVFKLVRGDTLSPDYTDWPAVLGAPVDADGRPLVTGEQTLWCVYHDANPAGHLAPEGGTAPLGIEVQQTAYGFGWPVAFGNVVFVEFTVINKLANTLEDTYLGMFCDADLGGYDDDLIGCDPALNLGFGYNGDNNDEDYGPHPPALGVEILRGPTGPGGEPQGMAAFRGYSNGQDPMTPEQCYNCLKGLDITGAPIIDPTTSNPTTFQMSGDPVAGTGWLDGNPDDRRFILSSGPFTMAPGDTQRVSMAILVARSRGRLISVKTMKQYAVAAREAYQAGFAGWFLPATEAEAREDRDKATGGETDLPLDMASPGRGVAPIAGRPNLSVGPNPALGQTVIRVSSELLGTYELLIVDTAGRVVRRLSSRSRPENGLTVTWDGLTDSGAPAPPGIYCVRLTGAGQAASAKVVLLR